METCPYTCLYLPCIHTPVHIPTHSSFLFLYFFLDARAMLFAVQGGGEEAEEEGVLFMPHASPAPRIEPHAWSNVSPPLASCSWLGVGRCFWHLFIFIKKTLKHYRHHCCYAVALAQTTASLFDGLRCSLLVFACAVREGWPMCDVLTEPRLLHRSDRRRHRCPLLSVLCLCSQVQAMR